MKLQQLLAGAVIASALMAGSANAAINFSDNFDGEAGAPGNSSLNYNAFANWNVIGQVDVVATPNIYGLTGDGKYVDLDGTAGPGAIVSKETFVFNAGDFVTWSFDFSGNQRDENDDTFVFGLDFSGPGTAEHLLLNGTIGGGNFAYGQFSHTVNSILVGPHVGWTVSTYTFKALNSGSATMYFGTTSADNIGTLVDNVSLTTTPGVPEPATWAVMLMGFGGLGAALRRRRSLALSA